MTRPSLPALAALAALAFLAAPQARAQGLDLAFMPPEVAPHPLCGDGDEESADLDVEQGEDDEDRLFLLYLRRDVRALSAEDADRWFDFISDLLTWEGELDPTFAGTDEALARIALHVDAGRLDALRESGLLEALRRSAERLTGAQSMTLAQYFLNGVGVAPDAAYAHQLIRDAAYGGNAEALLTVARMEAAGTPIPDWDAPLDMTVTLAFGGMLGQMNSEVCGRAERIAQAYLDGDVVTRNPGIARAWLRFAADLGGGHAAWRLVEFQLAAAPGDRDEAELRLYLDVAARHGYGPDEAEAEALRAAGLADLLPDPDAGAEEGGDGRPRPLASFLSLEAHLDGEEPDGEEAHLAYLQALTRLGSAPGWVFTRLAEQVILRDGRWAGEVEVMALLEEATVRGDADGMRLLGQMLVRYRHDPTRLDRAADLLAETVDRFGLSDAMHDLDGLYRCQAPDAPRVAEAEPWAEGWRASGVAPVETSIEDSLAASPFDDPWLVARIQAQAIRAEPAALSRMMERVDRDPRATEDARRLWAARAQPSDKSLELFAIHEFALATTPAARDEAVALFRRVHLNNGVTSALDLSVALTDDVARSSEVADEIADLLTQAGRRGEGASIRLLARLQARTRTEADVFAEFAQTIEERGDFLALMFAIPHVGPEVARDYVDRAVSLMNCGTKDSDELGDAATLMGEPALSDHWRQVGLAIDGGHVLSRLQLEPRQVRAYDHDPAPTPAEVLARALAEGDRAARRPLFALLADPDLPTYDPDAAASQLLDEVRDADAGGEAWALRAYRRAVPEVRAEADARLDMRGLLERAASHGDPDAALGLGLLLREAATGPSDLSESLRWLQAAAEEGNVEAMGQLGRMLASGLGGTADREAALTWLDMADRGGDPEAGDLARLLRLSPQG